MAKIEAPESVKAPKIFMKGINYVVERDETGKIKEIIYNDGYEMIRYVFIYDSNNKLIKIERYEEYV